MDRAEVLVGCLLGTAVGDALGLPREGLGRVRAARLFGTPSASSPLEHRLLPGHHGMFSDDTEHACLVSTSLLAAPDDPRRFARSLAWGLRLWFLGLPAGIGSATLRSVLKLWIGFSPERSGVFSAGNGPAMRAPLLGACLAFRASSLEAWVRASTRLTHTDPRAEAGALALARAAAFAARHGPPRESEPVLRTLREDVRDPELLRSLDLIGEQLSRGAEVERFAEVLGQSKGISGYVHHTVPASLYAWLKHPTDFVSAVTSVITLGGDSDTTGAIVGALAGTALGRAAIPSPWLNGLLEWPRPVSYLESLGRALSERFPERGPGADARPPKWFWPGLLPRNLLFFAVVLRHGFRRLLPPYG
jgi:ADP-ribosylglycohydrolase